MAIDMDVSPAGCDHVTRSRGQDESHDRNRKRLDDGHFLCVICRRG